MYSQLIRTILEDDAQSLKRILPELKQQIQRPFSDKQTPLTIAIKLGHAKQVRILLQAGALAQGLSIKGEPLLNYTVRRDDLTCMKLLIEFQVDINATDGFGFSALGLAVALRQRAMVALLLGKGADISLKDILGNSLLHIAVDEEDEYILRALLEKNPELDVVNNQGETPLLMALAKKNYLMTQLIIHAKQNKGHQTGVQEDYEKIKAVLAKELSEKYGTLQVPNVIASQTPLMMAILAEDLTFARNFTSSLDLEVTDHLGNTAFLICCRLGQSIFARLLIDYGVNLHHVNASGKNALILSVEGENIAIIQKLVNKKINVHHTDKLGDTALHYAVRLGNAVIIEYLLSHGLNPKTPDGQNNPPIFSQTVCENLQILDLFLMHGADPNQKNSQGNTPLINLIRIAPTWEGVLLLLNWGANPKSTNVFQQSPATLDCSAAVSALIEAELLMLKNGLDSRKIYIRAEQNLRKIMKDIMDPDAVRQRMIQWLIQDISSLISKEKTFEKDLDNAIFVRIAEPLLVISGLHPSLGTPTHKGMIEYLKVKFFDNKCNLYGLEINFNESVALRLPTQAINRVARQLPPPIEYQLQKIKEESTTASPKTSHTQIFNLENLYHPDEANVLVFSSLAQRIQSAPPLNQNHPLIIQNQIQDTGHKKPGSLKRSSSYFPFDIVRKP